MHVECMYTGTNIRQACDVRVARGCHMPFLRANAIVSVLSRCIAQNARFECSLILSCLTTPLPSEE
jgi:hypothetical protein